MAARKVPANPKDIEIGARLKALRLARGLSMEKVAGHCGITFQQIQKYERGSNRISGSRFYQLAELFEVPVAAFFGEAVRVTRKAA